MLNMTGAELIRVVALFSAALVMGMGAVGAGLAEGYTAAKACEGVAKRPDQANLITRTMLIGQAVTESTCIYALIIALILIFVAK